MNALLSEIRRSLIELDKGLKGQLNMSQSMEDLSTAFGLNEWPGRNPFAQVRLTPSSYLFSFACSLFHTAVNIFASSLVTESTQAIPNKRAERCLPILSVSAQYEYIISSFLPGAFLFGFCSAHGKSWLGPPRRIC